jgi:hypothetical protein
MRFFNSILTYFEYLSKRFPTYDRYCKRFPILAEAKRRFLANHFRTST